MSANGGHSLEWEAFLAQVAAVAETRAAEIGPEMRLVEDLGFDSVAIVELLVALMEEYGATSLPDDLETRNWEGVTVRGLFAELRTEAE